MSGPGVALLGVYVVAVGLLLGSLLVALWPAVQQVREAQAPAATAEGAALQQAGAGQPPARSVDAERPKVDWLGLVEFQPIPETTLLLTVFAFGALGAFVHTLTSFVDYAGNRKLMSSWVWWYLLRPFLGAALAGIFYVTLRGGFFGQDASAADVSPFGVAALAGLTGLFSKQATDKLREVFDTLFRTEKGGGDDQRADALTNPRPVVRALVPHSVVVGSGDLELKIVGEQFTEDSAVLVNDSAEKTRTITVSVTELTVRIDADLLAAVGRLMVKVRNPPPGGGTSEALPLEVTGPGVGVGEPSSPDNDVDGNRPG